MRWALVMLWPALALATEGAPRKVTLEQAYEMAARQNVDVAVARAQAMQADALLDQAWALLKPTVDATGTYTYRDEATVVPFGDPPVDIEIIPQDDWSVRLSVRQPLFDARSLLGRKIADDISKAAHSDAEAAKRRGWQSTARAWYAVSSAHRVLEVNERLQDVAQESLEAAQARFATGAGTRLDATRAGIDLRSAERQVVRARAALADAQDALGLVLGLDQPIDVVLTDAEEPLPTQGAPQLALRPELRAARLRESIAERGVRAGWWDLAPTLDAEWALSWLPEAGAFGRETSWQLMANLKWTLYDGGVRYGVIDEYEAAHAEARLRLKELEFGIRAELRAAERAVTTRQSEMEVAKEELRLAREAHDLARTAYKAGAATNLEYIQAQQALRSAEVAFILSRAQWQLARIELRLASGLPPRG